jgi:hypothetical protein
MALPISDEQAKQLLDNGHIDDDTYNKVVTLNGAQSAPAPMGATNANPMPTAPAAVESAANISPPPPASAPVPDVVSGAGSVAPSPHPAPEAPAAVESGANISPPTDPNAPSYAPVHLVNNTTTKAPNAVISAVNSGQLHDASKQVNEHEADVDRKAATAETVGNEKISSEYAANSKAIADHAAQTEMALADNAKKQAELEKSYADVKIDPDHFMKSQGTWGRIGLALLGGLGGIGGGNNPVLDVINGRIKTDIENQKGEVSKLKDQLQATAAKHGVILSDQNAWQAAKSQATVSSLEAIRASMNVEASKRKGDGVNIARDKANITLDQMTADEQARARAALDTAKAAAAAAGAAREKELYNRGQDSIHNTLAQGTQSIAQQNADTEAGKAGQVAASKQVQIILPDGTTQVGNAPTPEIAAKINTETAKYDTVNGLVTKLADLRSKITTGGKIATWNDKDRSDFQAVRAQIFSTILASGDKEGKDSKAQQELLEKSFPDLSVFTPAHQDIAAYNQYMGTYRSGYLNGVRTSLSPGQVDPNLGKSTEQTNTTLGATPRVAGAPSKSPIQPKD